MQALNGIVMHISKFLRAQDGNFAVMFGLMLLPLSMAVGLTFDYSRIANAETDLQSALDAAALASR